jgi:hypothetical protein
MHWDAHLPVVEVVLDQVQQLRHGGEQQHPVLAEEELHQHAVQPVHLATLPHVEVGGPNILHGVAEVRVVAHLHNKRNQNTQIIHVKFSLNIKVGSCGTYSSCM